MGLSQLSPFILTRIPKETVCPKETPLPLEQCDFKEDGLVKQCMGTVTLDTASSASDISCHRVSRVSPAAGCQAG
nr:cathelicidin-3-like [Cavia porcellus]